MLITLKYILKIDFGKATLKCRYGWRFSKQMFHISAAKFIVVHYPYLMFHRSLVLFKVSTLSEVFKMVVMYLSGMVKQQ